VLPTLPSNSVHCVVTSPPYYALRDYGTARWDGGDAACDHRPDIARTEMARNGDGQAFRNSTRYRDHEADKAFADTCGKCGARRIDRQLGLEATLNEYLATMVAVFRKIRRVMRNDAVAFINMGDSYQDKQLLMMPARLALALQADGWWLRSDVIWAKPNPMPESCTDRPTSAYEHVFLLTKSARYFWDADAVREEAEYGRRQWSNVDGNLRRAGGNPDGMPSATVSGGDPSSGRNLRNVWTIATEAFPDAHFATYPTALVDRCIRAGTSERGCCAQCGKPWRRVVDKAFVPQPDVSLQRDVRLETQHDAANQWPGTPRGTTSATTTGWQPSCEHDADVVPATVLDPFAGASTTLLVAQQLQRDAIGVELNPEYVRMGRERIEAEAGLFADVRTLDDVPADAALASEPLGSPDYRSAYSDLDGAQPSLWEWDRELLPT
jgi:DNA modification methylase